MTKETTSKKLFLSDIIIFGGLGDLSLRKILPAIYYRLQSKQLSNECKVILISRQDINKKEFEDLLSVKLEEIIKDASKKDLSHLISICEYYNADLTQKGCLNNLKSLLRSVDNVVRLFYFSVSSSLFGSITKNLKEAQLITPKSRVVLEKPLGHNGESSKKINNEIADYFNESQIFRIDHYLGKETVQNLMVLRFTNNLYENAWNAQNIDNIQITVSENLGVGNRGGFYDKYGALLDMVQNHLLQLMCLVAIEPPNILDANTVRDEKLKVLKSLRPIDIDLCKTHTVKGQYTRGKLDGKEVKSYLEDIDKFSSDTETFVAIRAYIDNWRWAGVPFYLRTGKRLSRKHSQITINFKNIPHNIFPGGKSIVNNKLIINLQPEESIELVQTVKTPGPGGYRYKPISLVLDYGSSFKERFPEAYERLLIDVIRGNQTLFMRKDEVEASWEWIDSINESWTKSNLKNQLYSSGSNGPGDHILLDNHEWNE
ncbi:MAG: glucose-6-phosphate dehydrogenase [Bacteroidetes bacterium MED-G21]|nr:MAG: glucose-6-phosphate dehydrogenase [Bacteroidetes bacterium MED-G21]